MNSWASTIAPLSSRRLRYVPAFGVQLHFAQPRIDAFDTARLAELAQVLGKAPGIEMHRPIEVLEVGTWCFAGHEDPTCPCQLGAEGVVVYTRALTCGGKPVPDVVKRDRSRLDAVAPEGMHEAMTLVLPAFEFNAEFYRAVGGAHDFKHIELQRFKIALDGGNRCLADANRTDLRRFDQRDLHTQPPHPVRQ